MVGKNKLAENYTEKKWMKNTLMKKQKLQWFGKTHWQKKTKASMVEKFTEKITKNATIFGNPTVHEKKPLMN